MIKNDNNDKKRENINNALNTYILNEEWDKGLELINRNEKYFIDDHWLIAQKAHMFYEKMEYKRAKLEIDKAYELNPYCPIVNDYKASILRMLEDYNSAIEIWKKLLSIDINNLAYGECGEGMKWALSFLNDARYLLALSYFEINEFDSAMFYIDKHIVQRKRGQFSNMTKKMAFNLKQRIIKSRT